jgi:hypothetical protein
MPGSKATASRVQRKDNLATADYILIDRAAIMDSGFSRVRRCETARRCRCRVGRPAARRDCVDFAIGLCLGFHRSRMLVEGIIEIAIRFRHRVPRCSMNQHQFPPLPAPCLMAAASLCATHVRWRGERLSSNSPQLDHTVPHFSRHPYHL